MKRVSDVLRDAISDATQRGVSLYRIAKECELDDSIVYRFYHDESGLALTSVDRLCDFLGLELIKSGPGAADRMAEAGAGEQPRRGAKRAKTAKKKGAKKKAKTAKKAAKKKTAAKKAPMKKGPAKKAAKKKTAKKTAKKKAGRGR